MVLGLGTGSTAAFVVEGLAARVAAGLRVVGIPTSERTAAQARRLGIPIATFAEYQKLDLTIDGADEVELGTPQPDQGAGRRAAARKDRRRGEPAAGHRRRPGKARRAPRRAHAGAGRGDPVRLAGDRRGAGGAGLRSRAALHGRRAAFCHRRRQLHPRLPVRADRRSGRARDAHRDDRRRGRERAVCRAQLGRRRRLGHRGRGLDPAPERRGTRHEKNFARRLGCRRHARHHRKGADAARDRRRRPAARARHRILDLQQPPALRPAHADRRRCGSLCRSAATMAARSSIPICRRSSRKLLAPDAARDTDRDARRARHHQHLGVHRRRVADPRSRRRLRRSRNPHDPDAADRGPVVRRAARRGLEDRRRQQGPRPDRDRGRGRSGGVARAAPRCCARRPITAT